MRKGQERGKVGLGLAPKSKGIVRDPEDSVGFFYPAKKNIGQGRAKKVCQCVD
jgi:hypothetical protein